MSNFVYPKYSGESLLNIPSTILLLFGAQPFKKTLPKRYYQNALNAEKIILLLVDGLGDKLFQKEALKHQFFQNFKTSGFYTTITTVFPSTTAAAISTLNSGLTPYEHGLPEWFVYFEEIDCVIQTLPFVAVVPKDEQKILNSPQGMLFNQKTIYQYLKVSGVKSFIFIHQSYLNSPYNQTASKGGEMIVYQTLMELVTILTKTILETSGKAYYFVYWADVDSAQHLFGPQSQQAVNEISRLSSVLQNEFVNKIESKLAENVAILLTADHGQVPTNPKQTFYLDTIDGFVDNLQVSSYGNIIPPSGGVRDVFIHAKEDKVEFIIKLLKDSFQEKAEVLKIKDAIEAGLFGGGKMHAKFLSRVGNILILARDYNTFWYHYAPDIVFNLQGHHGGLTEEEMLIPFGCARLSQIKN